MEPRALRVCPVTRRSARERSPPAEVPASPAAAPRGLTPRCAPSREGSVLPGVLFANGLRGYRVPRSRLGLGFSPGPARFLRPPSAPPFDGVSSSLELPASSRVLRPARRPSCLAGPRDPAFEPKSASLGVRFPHRGVNDRRPPPREESQPRGQVPPSTFLTSSTVCSANRLRGLVSSRCHVQGLPFRGLSLAAEPYRVSPAFSCPLDVGRTRL